MDQQEIHNHPKPFRRWSDEAVRGSLGSTSPPSSSNTPPRQEATTMEDDTTMPLIDEWLSHLETDDPSTILDTVSDMVSQISSPVTSLASPTFPNFDNKAAATLLQAPFPTTSRSTKRRSEDQASASRPPKRMSDSHNSRQELTAQSTEHDLRCVGAFADIQEDQPRCEPPYFTAFDVTS
ncbi:hypothetical protein G7046_g8263 [Stylonectria norvegica]|nr:hypothetical protein G7046_g8263 [Stylonectria norvegica]